jgi:ketosteroid isomerase-like protein
MMRTGILRALGGLMLLLASAFGATAQSIEIEGTINSQFEAFRADDFDTAFTYATPQLQQLFQSPQNFRRMVTDGYPMVWHPAEVRYLELRERGDAMWQKVQITDAKGVTHILDYMMEQTDMGWRIGAVQILDAPGATA